jgi:hypothetical protein
MTDLSVSVERPVTTEWTQIGWLRSHTGYLVALGLFLMVVVQSVLYSTWSRSPLWNFAAGTVILAPFFIVAIVLAPSSPGRRTAAALLFVAAGAANESARSTRFQFSETGQLSPGVLLLLSVLLGLTGWLVLTRRSPAAFLLLIPLALFGYAWDVNQWVAYHESIWLHDLFVPWPSNRTGPLTVVYGLWASLDLAVAIGLAALAGRLSAIGAEELGSYRTGYPSGSAPVAHPAGVPASGAPTSGAAIASLVCGIAGMFLFFPATIPAIICGHVARARIRRTGEGGAGLALAGLILGYLGLVIVVAVIIGFFVLVAAANHASSY